MKPASFLGKILPIKKEEKEFFSNNSYFDYSNIVRNIETPLFEEISSKNKEYFDKTLNFDKSTTEEEVYKTVYNNLDPIIKYLDYDKDYENILKKYWDFLRITPIFLWSLRHSEKKDLVYPNDEVKNIVIKMNGGSLFYKQKYSIYQDKYNKYKTKYLLKKRGI